MPKRNLDACDGDATLTTKLEEKRNRLSDFEWRQEKFVMVINLKRRADRDRSMRSLLRGALKTWQRIDAVDGRTLTWQSVAEAVSVEALSNALWAEERGVPTICRKTGSFSPHLTLSAVGCALSHRKAWQTLAASKFDWALILEDDVSEVARDLDEALERTVKQLPSSWQLCYVGFHESSGNLLPSGQRLRLRELEPDESQTGLFGYLLRRSTAAELLADKALFPLTHQIDVQLGMREWRPSSRFVLNPEAVLVHSPKSEEGACDSDVQTMSDGSRKAHVGMKDMLLL